MLEVDGSQRSGSGTILRLSIALSAILQKPLHIYNIRHKRPKPGLKPQHLKAVLTAANICQARIKGAKVNSEELWFCPSKIAGGRFYVEIGTAGSIPMLLLTVLPICAHAKKPTYIDIVNGGTDVSHSPTINYLKFILLPVLRTIGLETHLIIHKYGYYPKGLGSVSISVSPNPRLLPFKKKVFGKLECLNGISVCTYLGDRNVSKRQAEAASNVLELHGHNANIEVVNDYSNPEQKGSSITLWARTNSSAILGSDSIGEIRKPSEVIGKTAAESLIREIQSKATVDVHLADMLIPYIAMAEGKSVFFTHSLTDHLDTNISLIQEILDVKIQVNRMGKLYRILKTG